MTHICEHSFQLTLQLGPLTQKTEREVYPIKFTESINTYRNTKITVNGVEHQTLEKLENGLIYSQQQLLCYINTTRCKTRPQDAQTENIKLHRTERTSRCASDINLHYAFSSLNFFFKMFQVTFWCSPIRSFFTIF